MAFRYRQKNPQTNDFVDPNDWNENVREFTNELNGHLDRDNLKEKCITTASIKPQSFHQVLSDQSSRLKILDADMTKFLDVQMIQFETQYQGIVMCEWSGTWRYDEITTNVTSNNVQKLDYRILVNGSEVCRIREKINLVEQDFGYMVGALPVEAGIVTIQVQAKTVGSITEDNTLGVGHYPATGPVEILNRELVVVLRKA